MKFVRWENGTSEYSMVIQGVEESWRFMDDAPRGSRLLSKGGLLVGESVDMRPKWKRWFGLLGRVEFKNAEGEVSCSLEAGKGGRATYAIGETTEVLKTVIGFMKTEFNSRSIKILMREHLETVANFEFAPSLDREDVMLIVGHLVTYHSRR